MMLSEDVVGSHLSESRRKITQLLEHPVARGVPSDVEVQKPSVLNHEEAIQELPCDRREKRDHRLAGSPRTGRIIRGYLATVRSETSKPSFSSSPWLFGAPHSKFSRAIRRMRVRNSSLTPGRPPRGRDRQRQ